MVINQVINQESEVVLIWVKEGFSDSELATINYEDAMDCLGVETGVKTYRINTNAYSKKHALRMYGSGCSDKLNGKDNTIKVTQQELAAL